VSSAGTADADAPPASENVNPAAPNAGTATLVTRFFPREVFFAWRMVELRALQEASQPR